GPMRPKRAEPPTNVLKRFVHRCSRRSSAVLFLVATFSAVAYLGLRSLPDRGAAYEPGRAGRSELQDGYRPRKEDLVVAGLPTIVVAGLPTVPLLTLPAG